MKQVLRNYYVIVSLVTLLLEAIFLYFGYMRGYVYFGGNNCGQCTQTELGQLCPMCIGDLTWFIMALAIPIFIVTMIIVAQVRGHVEKVKK